METWQTALRANPLPWLLEPADPAVRHLALRLLLDRPENSPEVLAARRQAMKAEPIATILAQQHPDGYWVKPGGGYSPKYTGTVWSLMFLDQLGADGSDSRIRAACEYMLNHTQAANGGFGMSMSTNPATRSASSGVIHCLNGNLLRALLGFGWLGDSRVERAVEWQARSVSGEGFDRYYRWGTSGPGFACGINAGLACAFGATKALRALARIPVGQRTSMVESAIERGVEFLLSHDPSVADYPTSTRVSANWFKPGFPSGFVADSLQIVEVMAELGRARDPRLDRTVEWIVSLQDSEGHWPNRNAYHGKLWADIDQPGAPSKWVTLRACYALKHAIS